MRISDWSSDVCSSDLSNLGDNIHGAVTLALVDIALFAASHQFGSLDAGHSVTLDLSTQFVGAGRIGEPLDAIVERVRETGRLIFLRGLVVQGEGDAHIVLSLDRKSTRLNSSH